MSRLELHEKLVEILGSQNVYFQPPESLKISYPCIVYQLNNMKQWHADSLPYNTNKSYSVTIIDKNPDTTIPDEIAKLPLCRFDRFYTADNLNHYVFTLY